MGWILESDSAMILGALAVAVVLYVAIALSPIGRLILGQFNRRQHHK